MSRHPSSQPPGPAAPSTHRQLRADQLSDWMADVNERLGAGTIAALGEGKSPAGLYIGRRLDADACCGEHVLRAGSWQCPVCLSTEGPLAWIKVPAAQRSIGGMRRLIVPEPAAIAAAADDRLGRILDRGSNRALRNVRNALDFERSQLLQTAAGPTDGIEMPLLYAGLPNDTVLYEPRVMVGPEPGVLTGGYWGPIAFPGPVGAVTAFHEGPRIEEVSAADLAIAHIGHDRLAVAAGEASGTLDSEGLAQAWGSVLFGRDTVPEWMTAPEIAAEIDARALSHESYLGL